MAKLKLKYFRDDLAISTWLLLGACLQTLLLAILPAFLATTPALLLLLSRVLVGISTCWGLLPDSSMKGVRLGRFSNQIPQLNGSLSPTPSDQEVVVLILGARSNHVNGRYAPGMAEVGETYSAMWKDAEENREKWGFLGKTTGLKTSNLESNNATIWISYWKNLESVERFAQGPAHKKGWDLFRQTSKKYPHIGILHETYAVPKGHWETIYVNFLPFGMGQTQHFTEKSKETGQSVSSLMQTNGATWRNMRSRMGQA
ncbi:hypothetical protein B0J14DRAFT_657385 [Halenospora varia]|nr:hypothetical protein B0J14DRAFT_657385 [Halenospora varia]